MVAPTDTNKLHTHALEAEKHLEQLATGAAALGASDKVVQSCTDMASACRQIADGLAKSMRDEPAPTEQQPTTDQAIAAHFAGRRAAAAGPPA